MKNKRFSVIVILILLVSLFSSACVVGGNGTGDGDKDKDDDPIIEPLQYEVKFDYCDNTNFTSQMVNEGEKATKPDDVQRIGYEFDGWFQGENQSSLEKTSYDFNAIVTKNFTLYAKWTAIEYAITYNNLFDGTHTNPSTYTIESEIRFVNPIRVGYDGSWDIEGITKGSTENKSINAVWVAKTYQINLDMQGGQNGDSTVNVTFAEQMPKAEKPQRDGYIFGGYFTQKDGQGKQYYNADMESVNAFSNDENPCTLYAKWSGEANTVVFDGNGKTLGTMNDVAVRVGDVIKLPDCDFIKTAYAFVGWNTKSDGSGETYLNDEDFSIGAYSSSIVLYAQWEAINVSFNPATPSNATFDEDYSVTLGGASAGDGTIGYVLSIDSQLPSGVTLDYETGTLSGRVLGNAGEYNFKIIAICEESEKLATADLTLIVDKKGIVVENPSYTGISLAEFDPLPNITTTTQNGQISLDSKQVLQAGTKDYSWTFVPNNPNYSIVKGVISLTVLPKLESPRNLKIVENKLTWDIVEDANEYLIDINGNETVVALNEFSLPDMVEANHYCLRVKAISSLETIKDSNYSQLDFIQGTQGLEFRLNELGTEYFVSKGIQELIGAIYIPKTYNDLPVTKIMSEAFKGCNKITRIVIPSSISEIAFDAFDGCDAINEIVTDVSSEHFKAIDGVLYNYDLTDIVYVPKAYKGTIVLQETITSIRDNTFNNRTGLLSITLNDGLTTIGENAFSGCSSLGQMNLPSSVVSIAVNAFSECSSLKIAWDYNSELVEDLYILYPHVTSVRFNKDEANVSGNLKDLYQLENIFLDENNAKYAVLDRILYNKARTEILVVPRWIEGRVVLAPELTQIADNQFSSCNKLTELVISSNVKSIGQSAFSMSGIKNIILPMSLETFHEQAFYNANELETVSIDTFNPKFSSLNGVLYNKNMTTLVFVPKAYQDELVLAETLLEINSGTFYYNSKLTSVVIGKNVSAIERNAFSTCYQLKSFIVNENNASYASFDGVLYVKTFEEIHIVPCGKTGKLELRDGLTRILSGDFASCFKITSLIIPKSVSEIWDYAFDDLTNLNSITVHVDNQKFASFDRVLYNKVKDTILYVPILLSGKLTIAKEVTTSASLTKINNNTFITEIDFEEGSLLTELNAQMFDGCTSIIKITIPKMVEDVNLYILNELPSLISIVVLDGNTNLYSYDGILYDADKTTIRAVPRAINGEVRVLGTIDEMFKEGFATFVDRNMLYSIEFEEGITKLDISQMFKGCEQLRVLIIPSSVNSVNSGFLYNAPSKLTVKWYYNPNIYDTYPFAGFLTEVVVPETVTEIKDGAFKNVATLKKVTLSEGLVSIGTEAFLACESLTSIDLPSGLLSIGMYAFTQSGLSSITIPKSITTIGSYAFSECNELKTIVFASDSLLENLPGGLFYNCGALDSVTFGSNVKSIGSSMFFGNTSLKQIILPSGLEKIESQAFSLSGLTSIIFPSSLTLIENQAFSNCADLASISFTSGQMTLEYNAFMNCEKLTTLTIPQDFRFNSVGDNVFEGVVIALTWYYTTDTYLYELTKHVVSIIISEQVTEICGEAFKGCVNLTELTIPSTVTSIDEDAFKGLTELNITWYYNPLLTSFSFKTLLKTVIFPVGLTEISSNAFNGAVNLHEVQIPKSVVTIGDAAFKGCVLLKDLEFSSNLETIGEEAFAGCESLTELTIPNTIKTLGNYAFRDCIGLTDANIGTGLEVMSFGGLYNCNNIANITLPFIGDRLENPSCNYVGYVFGFTDNSGGFVLAKLTTITILCGTTSGTFGRLPALKNVNFPNGITSIDAYAFYNCDSLESFVVPSSVTSIDAYAFYNCYNLKSITLPSGLVSIEEAAFGYCYSLESIDVPSSVTSIGLYAFNQCTSLNYISLPFVGTSLVSPEHTSFKYVFGGDNSSWDVPESLKTVVINGGSIEDLAFYDCRYIETIVINSEIDYVGERAFKHCAALSSITLPSTVKVLKAYAFYECFALEELKLPSSLITLEEYALSRTIIKEITLPTKLVTIGASAFYDCMSLTEIQFPSSLRTIEASAFYGCTSLTEIVVPSTVTNIHYAAFDALNLEITWYYNLSADIWAFNQFGQTLHVILPEGMTSILDETFKYVITLASIQIPSSVTSIGNSAFYGCSSLQEIVFPSSLLTIGESAFFGCDSLTSLEFPASLTTIGEYAFGSCNGLTTLIVPSTVTSVGKGAFLECRELVSVEFLANTTILEDYMFQNCVKLISVTLSPTINNISSTAFDGCILLSFS